MKSVAMLADCCLSEALYLSVPIIERFHSILVNCASHSGFQVVLVGDDALMVASRATPSQKQECALFLCTDCSGGLAPHQWKRIKLGARGL